MLKNTSVFHLSVLICCLIAVCGCKSRESYRRVPGKSTTIERSANQKQGERLIRIMMPIKLQQNAEKSYSAAWHTAIGLAQSISINPESSQLLLAILIRQEDVGRFNWGQTISAAEVQTKLSDDFDEFGDDEIEAGKVFDPLRGVNRVLFHFNDKMYFFALHPVAKVYSVIVPEEGRIGISRAFKNIGFPLRFVNNLFQLKFKRAGTEISRFVVNSTVGLGGFFDPASSFLNLKSADEDFGQTLGHYGVGDGFPITLPLLGPSNLRDAIGMLPNFLLNPATYLVDSNLVRLGIDVGEEVNSTSLHLGRYEILKKDALDPYTFLRDAYKQNRDKNIKE